MHRTSVSDIFCSVSIDEILGLKQIYLDFISITKCHLLTMKIVDTTNFLSLLSF